MKIILILLCLATLNNSASAMMKDDPWLSKVMAEFEYSQEHGHSLIEWDVDVWFGRDLAKYWLKSSGEYVDTDFENANIEAVYSHAVSAYWDQQFGLRHDFKPNPDGNTRSWLSFGYIGLAPYFIEVDARVYIGEQSSSQLFVELERELMLNQRWLLTSEVDITVNGSSNKMFVEGSGLSNIEFSLRLGYEPSRKLQPFIGLTATQNFGQTKDFIKQLGEDSGSLRATLGIEGWF